MKNISDIMLAIVQPIKTLFSLFHFNLTKQKLYCMHVSGLCGVFYDAHIHLILQLNP